MNLQFGAASSVDLDVKGVTTKGTKVYEGKRSCLAGVIFYLQ
jgi:hypothetical protein